MRECGTRNGTNLPEFTSSDNTLKVIFESDSSGRYKGFHANWTEIADIYYHYVYYDDEDNLRHGCATSLPDTENKLFFKSSSSEGQNGLIKELIKNANLQFVWS